MALDRRTREQMLAHCGEVHADDGVNPREYFQARRTHKKNDRKAKQLCQQISNLLNQVLSGEMSDDVLRELHVASVLPTPDSSRLLVSLHIDRNPEQFDFQLLSQRLDACKGYLRGEVAAGITRRKTPELVFRVVPASSHPTHEPEDNP